MFLPLFLVGCMSFHQVDVQHGHSPDDPQDEIYLQVQTKLGPLTISEWLVYCRQFSPGHQEGFMCYRVINLNDAWQLNQDGEVVDEIPRQ